MNRSKTIDTLFKGLLLAVVSLTVIVTFSVLAILLKECIRFFSEVSLFEFLFGTRWTPLLEPKSFGVLPLVLGTMQIVIGSILFALPVGVCVAIYLSEFASAKAKMIIKPTLEVLAGIPTVVYGYFALTFITPILKMILPSTEIFNAASGAIVVGIMILPMISSLCDDAFNAIPNSLKEGGYALGATSFEVSTMIVLPAASARVGAAIILAMSRAIGETMAVTLAAGATPTMSFNPLQSIQTMTAYIVQVSLGDIPADGIEYLTSYAVASLLFILTLLMNFFGGKIIRKRMEVSA